MMPWRRRRRNKPSWELQGLASPRAGLHPHWLIADPTKITLPPFQDQVCFHRLISGKKIARNECPQKILGA